MTAALGCAPLMPPSPAVTKILPRKSGALRYLRPWSSTGSQRPRIHRGGGERPRPMDNERGRGEEEERKREMERWREREREKDRERGRGRQRESERERVREGERERETESERDRAGRAGERTQAHHHVNHTCCTHAQTHTHARTDETNSKRYASQPPSHAPAFSSVSVVPWTMPCGPM